MTLSRVSMIVSCWCLAATATLCAEDPKCPRGYQPYANRCISQRMADYISCIEATGANQQRVESEVSNAQTGQFSAGAKGAGSGVIAKGSGSLVVGKSAEQALANKFEQTWFSNALVECRKALVSEKSVGTGSATKPNPGPARDSSSPKPQETPQQEVKPQSEQFPVNPNRPATEFASKTDEKNVPPPPATASQKTESATTGSAKLPEGTKDEAVQSAKAANPSDPTASASDQNGNREPTVPAPYGQIDAKIDSTKTSGVHVPNLSPGGPQTSKGLLRQIEELLEKDRELSELKSCPATGRVQLSIVGGKISYTTCIELCFASWVNVDPKRLDFEQINVSQDEDPELATVSIPCAKELDFCARISKGAVGPFSRGALCKKKKTSEVSRYFVMDVHAENADAIVKLWKDFARAGF